MTQSRNVNDCRMKWMRNKYLTGNSGQPRLLLDIYRTMNRTRGEYAGVRFVSTKNSCWRVRFAEVPNSSIVCFISALVQGSQAGA